MAVQRRALIWRLFPSHMLVTLVAVVALELLMVRTVRDFHMDRLTHELGARCSLAAEQARPLLSAERIGEIDTLCKKLGQESDTRFTIILPGGQVAGDSMEDPAKMENHADRREVLQALNGASFGTDTRMSRTLGKRMLYVAMPVKADEAVIGVVRAALPTSDISRALASIHGKILLAGITVLGFAAAVSWEVSRRITAPIELMRRGAERFARGELDQRLPEPPSREMADLASAMNQMAAQLDERIRAALRQRSEQEAVLSSMVEGVLAVDKDSRLMSINQAAARLLALDPVEAVGRSYREMIRNLALKQFIADGLGSETAVEREIAVPERENQVLQAHGAVLRDAESKGIGVVVVLHDITRIRRLERLRRDFVANVSHELRTPVTSIKGFVETLLDGALANHDEAVKFLRIVGKHADRLNAIIEDLLTLSRVEQEGEKGGIATEQTALAAVLENAVELCGSAAAAKDIRIEINCPENLSAWISPAMVEQAVVNLLDNAIKHSDVGGPVCIEAAALNGEVVIRVKDDGCGIPPEHLPRLFERFYRVDKARSRGMGGTGLGLAIVKHIAQAHGGRVAVSSRPGTGSVFAIHLPVRPPTEITCGQ